MPNKQAAIASGFVALVTKCRLIVGMIRRWRQKRTRNRFAASHPDRRGEKSDQAVSTMIIEMANRVGVARLCRL
jgi:hypothetical protein